jgi:16S rRNA (uracil1498-N3)-methyltransferase
MTQRYFAETPITLDHVVLTGSEAHHLRHVMRATVGQQVTLFDGSGSEFVATVVNLGRTEAQLKIESRHEIDREPPMDVTLGVGLPKGDRQRWLVEKAVEIGVTRLVFLNTERSVAVASQKTAAKLQRAAIEAAKQCGRNRLMSIEPPMTLDEYLGSARDFRLKLFAHPPASSSMSEILQEGALRVAGQRVMIAVGPEGGFTDAEFAMAQTRGWRCISLGHRMLRTETAAIFLASAIIASVPQ